MVIILFYFFFPHPFFFFLYFSYFFHLFHFLEHFPAFAKVPRQWSWKRDISVHWVQWTCYYAQHLEYWMRCSFYKTNRFKYWLWEKLKRNRPFSSNRDVFMMRVKYFNQIFPTQLIRNQSCIIFYSISKQFSEVVRLSLAFYKLLCGVFFMVECFLRTFLGSIRYIAT